jgi:serpin B
MKMKFRMVTLVCILVFHGVSLVAREPEPSTGGIVSANTRFGFYLVKVLARESDENIFISPLSISMALAMTYNGAAGETERAMAGVLGFQGMPLDRINRAYSALIKQLMDPSPDIQIELANSLWADESIRFKERFISNNREFYSAEVTNLPLNEPGSIRRIDQWIREKTRGQIARAMDQSDLDAILFLVNTVYFKGAWKVGFRKEYTKVGDFTCVDGSTRRVPMMMSQSEQYGVFETDGFQAVSLPYGKGAFSLYLFLPERESNLQSFLDRMNTENWETWMSGFVPREVLVVLPRLNLDYEADLKAVLRTMGMGIAFTPDADFKKMCQGRAWIDYVKHLSHTQIDEEGTEASAATIVKMKRGRPFSVVFDRPFFLAIRDQSSGAVLFAGVINQP